MYFAYGVGDYTTLRVNVQMLKRCLCLHGLHHCAPQSQSFSMGTEWVPIAVGATHCLESKQHSVSAQVSFPF